MEELAALNQPPRNLRPWAMACVHKAVPLALR